MTRRTYFWILWHITFWVVLTFLLYLLFHLPSAEGDGNGDWPYSGSGDWTITTETHVWNETIELDGNLDIMFFPLYFEENVTLTFTGPNREINVWIEEFHVYNSTIRADSPVMWTFAGGFLFLNHSTISDVEGHIALGQSNEWVMHSTFIGDDNYTTAFEVNGDDILFLNNTFENFTDHGIGAYFSDGITVRENTFINITTDLVLYDCTNPIVSNNQDLWYLSITLLDALRQSINAANVYLFDKSNIALTDHVTDSGGTVEWIRIDESDSPVTIVAEKHGNLAETTVSITSSTNVTLIMRDYLPTAIFHTHFFNSFTGLGEDSELLKVFYSVSGGSWVRTSGLWSIQHTLGTSVDVRVMDYYDMTVTTTSIVISNVTDYHLDFSIPLATVHLENTLGLSEFIVHRIGSTAVQNILGTEFRVIAAFEGNSTHLYEVSWENTTTTNPENGTGMFIENGSFSFTAEASNGQDYVLQNVGTHIDPVFDATISSGPTQEWWESKQIQKYLVIAGIISAIILPISIFRTMEWWRRKLEKQTQRRERS